MNDEYYIRMNTEGAVEIRTPMEVPIVSFMSCEDFVSDALESIPQFLADNEVILYKSNINITTCDACGGTGCEDVDRDYTNADFSWAAQGGWGNPPRDCTVCDGTGNYI